ncbi:MAG: hypothetical protein K0V04_06475 [Deltaproteobacteria bacterium]|nr:hypothetical protein [Deltaproteobacteria bacterium]
MASLVDNALSTAEVSRLLDGLEEAVEDLRISYEKYFLGIERQAPAHKHAQVKAQLRRVEQQRVRSTALRFRLAGLRARLVTYQHYWNRILGEIERGTYRRDIQQRVRRREQARVPPAPAPAPEPSPEVDEDEKTEPRTRPSEAEIAAAARRPRGRPAAEPASAVPGMETTAVRRLFDDLVQAKQAAGEKTQGLTMRALARKLSRELPKLRERHGGRVEFEVATVGGKVRLRARSVDP